MHTRTHTYIHTHTQSGNADIISEFYGTAVTSPDLFDKGNGQILGVSDADMLAYAREADVIIIANQYCSAWTETGMYLCMYFWCAYKVKCNVDAREADVVLMVNQYCSAWTETGMYVYVCVCVCWCLKCV